MRIVEINNLTKEFGKTLAVDNIDLFINEGEIYGFLGPNGAGKTTTINIISGLLMRDSGTIKIFGEDFDKRKNLIKGHIGIVPQDIAIYEDLTAYENVSFFASLYGLKGKELKERTLEALEFVGLSDMVKTLPKKFSGGMKRRLNIACAIAHRPKLIIMDEPTVGVDPQSRNHILSSIRKLNEMGSTIIYTTHYMEEAENLCERVGIIDHGKIIAEGTIEELKSLVVDKNIIKIGLKNTDEANIDEILNINGVENVDIDHGNIVISYKKEVMCLDKIIHFFTLKNIEIISIETVSPNLETVFLNLTGRNIRN